MLTGIDNGALHSFSHSLHIFCATQGLRTCFAMDKFIRQTHTNSTEMGWQDYAWDILLAAKIKCHLFQGRNISGKNSLYEINWEPANINLSYLIQINDVSLSLSARGIAIQSKNPGKESIAHLLPLIQSRPDDMNLSGFAESIMFTNSIFQLFTAVLTQKSAKPWAVKKSFPTS